MPLKVLVVDDREENLLPICDIIASERVDVVTALSGEKALKKLMEHEDIGLALIDVHMPSMDGYELASLMRSVEKTRHIPIIFVTADTSSEEKQLLSHGSGAVDVIFKPLNPYILRAKVAVFRRLEEKRQTLMVKLVELEEARAEAERERQRAAEADRLKGAFLASVSHEIRTPLTAITGFAELLKKKTFSQKTHDEYLEVILRSGKNLIQIVNDVLDLSKIEANQLSVTNKIFSPSRSIEDALALLRPLAAKNKVQFDLHIDEDFPSSINNDKTRFEQILVNLIGNAIKFTQNGRVTIRARAPLVGGEERPRLRVEIVDSGIGIEAHKQGNLFKPFTQADASISQTYGGTGLGLALSKKLAKLLGGDVWLVDSRPGKGTCVAFECLDRGTADGKATQESEQQFLIEESLLSQSPLKDLHILFVDDSVDNQILVQTVLADMGAEIVIANNGMECLQRMERERYDAILMDYQMPGLNGLETTQKLREMGHDYPIILLTANAMKGEKENALAAGASGYVTKPIVWLDLVNEILNSMKSKR